MSLNLLLRFMQAGLSISIIKSIQQVVKSMSINSMQKKKEGLCMLKVAMAYDNFDINFKTSEPMIMHHLSFVSATSVMAIPHNDVRIVQERCESPCANRPYLLLKPMWAH